MDIKVFAKILKDKNFTDYKKMKYKYDGDFDEFIKVLDELYYKELPLLDFDGNNIVFIENHYAISQSSVKLLLQGQTKGYGIKNAEDEIIATSAIESIDFSRDSVRKILKGMAPRDKDENRILGVKQGLEAITDTSNKITEENIYKLYMMMVGAFLSENDKLKDGNFYRHDDVFVVSDHIEHSGVNYKLLSSYMKNLVGFINAEDDINDLVKAAIIHFYIAFIHPYFDGNGRMARLIHLWFLIQKGYQSALFLPFSSQIEKSRKAYYDAYTAIEENKNYSNKIDVTPFITYFVENVYNKISTETGTADTLALYAEALKTGKITEKETKLWRFVLSYYGTNEFSTKQLEKDFGDAAYATIRGFVLKFEKIGLLISTQYGPRVKYSVVRNTPFEDDKPK